MITVVLTPEQRRARIHAMAEADPDYIRMKAEYEPGKKWFENVVGRLPRKLRNRLFIYPGMGYFMHHKMLNIICDNMKFCDED